MRLSCLVPGALVLLVAPAIGAEPARSVHLDGSASVSLYDFVATQPNATDLQFARQVLPPSTTPTGDTTALVAQSRILYLNKNGVTLSPGNNDSRTNRSSIVSAQTTIQPWAVSATTWTATVACVREIFAPFDVQVVETDPGNVPHIEAIFGGSPGQVGLPNGVAGVSPFTTDCSIIENSIVFTFTDVIPADARLACEIQAQEIAHSFGLDHELLASDPMTYLPYNGNRAFQNQTASCGEDVSRPCGIGGSVCRPNQNSVTLLTERLGAAGAAGDTIAPSVDVISPTNGAVVPPGFTINFDATDNIGVTSATLYVDGTMADTLSAPPFAFVTSSSLSEGTHTFKVEATDGKNIQAQEITVTLRKGAQPPDGTGGGGTTGGDSDIAGGCSAGGHGSYLLAFALLGLVGVVRRRR